MCNKETQEERFKDVLMKGKELNTKAVPCTWTTNNQKQEERQVKLVNEMAKDIEWKTTSQWPDQEQTTSKESRRASCWMLHKRQQAEDAKKRLAQNCRHCPF
jgi:hypothetical protein